MSTGTFVSLLHAQCTQGYKPQLNKVDRDPAMDVFMATVLEATVLEPYKA